MKREIVSSSNIASIGYDAGSQTLEIEFNHGGIYHYKNVPKDIYEDLMNASSHGVYFNANIKNVYGTVKI